MTDGAAKIDRICVEMAVYCHEKIQFADMTQLADQTTDIMSNALCVAVRWLAENLIVAAISIYRGSNETAMLQPTHNCSIQAQARFLDAQDPVHSSHSQSSAAQFSEQKRIT
jgi:hypothetical protein